MSELDDTLGLKAYTRRFIKDDFRALIVFANNGEDAADVLGAYVEAQGYRFNPETGTRSMFIQMFDQMAGMAPDPEDQGMKSLMMANQGIVDLVVPIS